MKIINGNNYHCQREHPSIGCGVALVNHSLVHTERR